MIYIYDNGGSYSDHAIYFIEFAWDAERLLTDYGKIHGFYTSRGYLVGMAEQISWREPGNTTPLNKFLTPGEFFAVLLSPEQSGEVLALPYYNGGVLRYARHEEMLAAAAASPDCLHHLIEAWQADDDNGQGQMVAWLRAWLDAGCPSATSGSGGGK